MGGNSYETDSLVAGPVTQYEVLWLSEFFHSFPHVNLSFKIIESTFNPTATSYQESIMFISSLPVIWMLLTLIALTAYFCYRCCQPTETLNIKGKKKPNCLIWTIAVLTVITCAAIGVGFFGNEEMKKGTSTFIDAAESANKRFKDIEANVQALTEVLKETKQNGVLKIVSSLNDPNNVPNITARDIFLEYTGRTTSYVNIIQAAADEIMTASNVSLSKVINTTDQVTFYRWVSTIGLMSLLLVVCLFFLSAVAMASKCLIIFCTCLTVFCLVLIWTVTGAYLGLSMTVGDFCHDPNRAVQRDAGQSVNPVILQYYMNCSQDISNPFSKDLHQASESIMKINLELEKLKSLVRSSRIFKYRVIKNAHLLVGREMKKVPPFLQHLTAFADCRILHKEYVGALQGICHTGMAGIAFILLAGAVIGIMFTIIIILASRAWRHFGKNSTDPHEEAVHYHASYSLTNGKEYAAVDEDDPFIPRAQNSPSYHSGGRFSPPSLRMPGSTRHTGPEHLPLQGRQTPPPAYGDFYEDYNYTGGIGTGLGTNSRNRRDPNAPVQV